MEKEILKLIEDSSRILIITHVNPDGDTLGCASALKSFIGDKADILIQIKDNFNFPNTYKFLPKALLLYPQGAHWQEPYRCI